MKVLHLIESLEFGGAEKVVVHLANRMQERFEVSVCMTKRRGQLVDELNDKIQIEHLGYGEGNHLSLPFAIRRLIRKKQIDVLHIHDWGVFIEGVIAAIGTGCRVVLTVHGPYIQYSPGILSGFKRILRHNLERILSRHVGKIASVSEDIKRYITGEIGISASKIDVVHNGIKDIGGDYVSRKPDSAVVSFVTSGRFAPVKNHLMMIEAFHLLCEENQEVSLTLVGDGPEYDHLRQLVDALGISTKVKFLGFRNDVPEILSEHDVFLLSSDYEGISIALLEAMSLSLPAIVTRVGGLSEMVKDGVSGFLVPAGNPGLFAEAMRKLVNCRPKIHKFGRQARLHYLAEFNEDAVVSRYCDIYSMLISA